VLSDRYRLTERIAAGGMGEVWRGADLLLHRPIAVKVLLPALMADAEFITRFRTEARLMAALRHAGIVQVYDYGENATIDGRRLDYLVMEFVDGTPLSKRIQQAGRLGLAETLTIVAQVADALQVAHEAGIVHRDVKPANLLVRPGGAVVLVDFGVARSTAMTGLTGTNVVMGSAHYMAPEQAEGKPISPATDVYALGAVAFCCLTGRPPYVGDNPLAVLAQLVHGQPPVLPPDVPAPVASVVLRALAKDPRQRFPSAAAFAAAARSALRPGGTAQAPAQAQAPAARPAAPRPAAAGFATGSSRPQQPGGFSPGVASPSAYSSGRFPAQGSSGRFPAQGSSGRFPAQPGAAGVSGGSAAYGAGAGPGSGGSAAYGTGTGPGSGGSAAYGAGPGSGGSASYGAGAGPGSGGSAAYGAGARAGSGGGSGSGGGTGSGSGTGSGGGSGSNGRRRNVIVGIAAAAVILGVAGVAGAILINPNSGEALTPYDSQTTAAGKTGDGPRKTGGTRTRPATETTTKPVAEPPTTPTGEPSEEAGPSETPTEGEATNPREVCGDGYKVIDSAPLKTAEGTTKGKVYLLFNTDTGDNCVVTVKTTGLARKSAAGAFLEIQGGDRTTADDQVQNYAGPVHDVPGGACVKWGGAIGAATYESPFEHCG